MAYITEPILIKPAHGRLNMYVYINGGATINVVRWLLLFVYVIYTKLYSIFQNNDTTVCLHCKFGI